jgi:hypothetical protein
MSDMISLIEAIDSVIKDNDLPNGVKVANNLSAKSEFPDAIAGLEQRDANHDQAVFKASDYDLKEFGSDLKSSEVLVRVSTPLSNNKDNLNRSIAKIDFNKVTISFVDNDKYENEDKIVWSRGIKLKFLTIDPEHLNYFKR